MLIPLRETSRGSDYQSPIPVTNYRSVCAVSHPEVDCLTKGKPVATESCRDECCRVWALGCGRAVDRFDLEIVTSLHTRHRELHVRHERLDGETDVLVACVRRDVQPSSPPLRCDSHAPTSRHEQRPSPTRTGQRRS